ncbi:hypothetical protein M8U32_13035 [Enterobacter hormaechei]|nr:hypothetical protein [Enterobacter hormaechei]MCM8121332.1 hypothetical protein [Enterobacter hormaechei]
MSTTLKEWLLKTIAELEEERDAVPGAVNEDAAMALAAMKLALEMLSAEPVYQCEFCHLDSSGELQWHWEDVNKDFYDQYDSERRGERRVLYTAPPVIDNLAEAIIAAIEKEQNRLFKQDYLMDSKDCIDVIREEMLRLSPSHEAQLTRSFTQEAKKCT